MVMVSTAEAEGAQALFCYIADYLGAKKTSSLFKPYYKTGDAEDFFIKHSKIIDKAFSTSYVDIAKPKETVISYLIENKDWFISSMRIAEKIITEIDKISTKFSRIKAPNWQNLFYVHGDDDVMKVISELFASANKQSSKNKSKTKYFGDINKWSPADIYFASQKAKNTLSTLKNQEETRKNNLTFAVLNKKVGDLIKSGDLLPLSLKKVLGNVIVEKVNFNREVEEEIIAKTECTGIQSWKKMQGAYTFKNNRFKFTKTYSGGRDIYITIISDKKKGRIQIRHTPASKGRPSSTVKIVLSYVGSSALGGQVVGIPIFTQIIETVDSVFARKIREIWNTKYKIFERDANRYIDRGGGAARYKAGSAGNKEEKKKFNDDIGAISGLAVMNSLRDEIDRYFRSPKEKQHNVVRALFQYMASRTEFSSPFVIAKD